MCQHPVSQHRLAMGYVMTNPDEASRPSSAAYVCLIRLLTKASSQKLRTVSALSLQSSTSCCTTPLVKKIFLFAWAYIGLSRHPSKLRRCTRSVSSADRRSSESYSSYKCDIAAAARQAAATQGPFR